MTITQNIRMNKNYIEKKETAPLLRLAMLNMVFSCSFFIQRRFMQQQFLWTMKHIFVICSVKKRRSLFYIFLNILLFQGRHRTHKPGTEACHILALLLHSTIGSCDVIEAASWWVILLFGWPRPSHILSHAHNSPHCYCDITEEWG